jgi:hypothetical protein
LANATGGDAETEDDVNGWLILGTGGGSGYDWIYLGILLAIYGACVVALFAAGKAGVRSNVLAFPFDQVADSLRRLTGFPGWTMAGALTGLLMLLIAVIGFYWDVAWHIDYGRDENVLTPPHVMILVGLGGLTVAGSFAVLFAKLDGARVPLSGLALGVMGTGALIAFPIDNLWHDAYGLDLTLWSPPHLQLVTGGALGTLAVLLLLAEGLPDARPTIVGRAVLVMAAGAALVGLSVFQAEFDFGVPQFQVVYLPILVAATAGFILVLARLALGAWGALQAVLFYLVIRGLIALIVSGSLGHTFPRFPLYVAAALAVEGAALVVGTARRGRFALVAGALVGTLGMAGEIAWIGLSGYGPISSALLPKIALLVPAAAIAAAVLGAGLACAFSRGEERVPVARLAVAGAVLVAVLAVPLPRDVGDVEAVTLLDRTGDHARVEVRLSPADAAEVAVAFNVTSWQGGGRETAELEEVGPGRYVSSRPVPVTGRWKSLVALNRGDETMAAPVYLPADREIGASAVPAVPRRRVSFVHNTDVLLREANPGPPGPKVLAFGAWGLSVALWIAMLAFTARQAGRHSDEASSESKPENEPRRPALAGVPSLRSGP